MARHSFVFQSLAAIGALATQVMAQNAGQSVVEIYLPDYGADQVYQGTIISTAPTATEYSIGCPTTVAETDCPLGPGLYYTQGPSKVEIHLTLLNKFADVSCDMTSNTATCTHSRDDGSGPIHTVEVVPNADQYLVPLTLTSVDALATTVPRPIAPLGTGTGGYLAPAQPTSAYSPVIVNGGSIPGRNPVLASIVLAVAGLMML